MFLYFLLACGPVEPEVGVGVGDVDSGGDSEVFTIPKAPRCPKWYRDADDDHYGDGGVAVTSCTKPPGYVADNTDCDDGRNLTNPGADEFCNGIDDDCNGDEDETRLWYHDRDGDDYGDPRFFADLCGKLQGYTFRDGDCDDDDAAINPAATEECDGIDNNCVEGPDEDGVCDLVD